MPLHVGFHGLCPLNDGDFELSASPCGKTKKSERSRKMTNIKWWKAAGVRAVKTVAQTAVATIGTSAMLSEVNWLMVASASVLAGILSMLTSIAGLPEVE